MNSTNTNEGGWEASLMRGNLNAVFMESLDAATQSAIAPLSKFQQKSIGATADYLQPTTDELIWLPSLYEVTGLCGHYNDSESLTTIAGYVPFQYLSYQGTTGPKAKAKTVKQHGGRATSWWLRSTYREVSTHFCIIYTDGSTYSTVATSRHGIAPCFAI